MECFQTNTNNNTNKPHKRKAMNIIQSSRLATVAMTTVVLSCASLAFADAPQLIPAPRKLAIGEGVFVCNGDAAAQAKFETDAAIPKEGYRLSVTKDGIKVASSDEAGRFYALETLKQLAAKEGKDGAKVPCVDVEDSPRYSWRGFHLDECRHFFGKETVKALLDKMAAHKLNVFHWHLTDDQGWRIDVPGYPDLVRYGAVRSASPRHGTHPSRGTVAENAAALNGTRYGPFWYDEADLREIVAYAAARHIAVVPEVELPGHVYAALAAYPEFACFPENLAGRDPRTIWGIEQDVLCIGNARAVSFMEDVLAYVCRVFPGRYVHIGGDECPTVRWEACGKCRTFRAAHGIADAAHQQAWATRHFAAFLAERGKRAVGWDECLAGDVPADVVGMSWRDPDCAGAGHEIVTPSAALARGHEMVMSPNSYCYLDYKQGLADDPYQYARRTLTLARAYQFDPCAGIPEHLRRGVLGGQGNNWTEYTWNEYDLDWKVWPRAAALAECLWLGADRPGFDDFTQRLAGGRR